DVELTRGMMIGENNVLVAIENNGSWWRVTNNVTVEGSNLVVGGDTKNQDAGVAEVPFMQNRIPNYKFDAKLYNHGDILAVAGRLIGNDHGDILYGNLNRKTLRLASLKSLGELNGIKSILNESPWHMDSRVQEEMYLSNLGTTSEKLEMAARVIAAIENPQDIIVQFARPIEQRPGRKSLKKKQDHLNLLLRAKVSWNQLLHLCSAFSYKAFLVSLNISILHSLLLLLLGFYPPDILSLLALKFYSLFGLTSKPSSRAGRDLLRVGSFAVQTVGLDGAMCYEGFTVEEP
ncbi:40S ribosomal protein SA-like protein, partial [Tanacetum coccineum]